MSTGGPEGTMPDTYEATITGPDGTTQTLLLTDVGMTVDIGREEGDVIVDDPAISRVHLRLELIAEGVVAGDLGSSNGTSVNGHPITQRVMVAPGSEIQIGDSIITVAQVAAPQPSPPPQPDQSGTATVAPGAGGPVDGPPSGSPAAPPPLPPDFAAVTSDGIEVRYLPGTAAERSAKSVARAASKARGDLRGFGSESWGTPVVINLVDPFTDPADPQGGLVTGGAFVDPDRGEIWMVVTPESPPEPPHRVMALLFGAALPSVDDVGLLVEGYGLHFSADSSVDDLLGERQLPPFDHADPDERATMAVSYVRFLIKREGEDTFRQTLAAPAGRFEEAVSAAYGMTSTALEQSWRQDLATGEPDVKTGEFLRLSLRYLKPYKLRQAEIFVYMLLSLAFTSAFPFVTRELFDTAIPSGEFSEVLQLLIALGVAFVISLLASLRQAYQSAYVSGAVVRDIRQEMFEKLQHIPTSWFGNYPQGDVLSRLFSDVGQVQDGLSSTIGQGIFQAVSLVVSAVIMMTVNIPLGLVVLAGAPVVGFVYKSMAKGATTRSLAVQEDSAALFGVAAENYQANPVVKMFGLADHERGRFRRSSDRLFASQRRMSLYGGLFGLSVNMIVTLLRLFVLGFGAWLILEGEFTLGGLVAFLSIMGEVLSPVTVLTTLGQDIQASMGSLARINEVLDADLEPRGDDLGALAPIQQDIRIAGLGFSYTQERRALDGIDATIEAGTRVAFVGPSGSGKSTVLKMLMRMYEPDEGAVMVDGVDVRQRSLASLREQVGVVFQDPFLFDTTLRENIALGKPGATDAEIMAAAEAAEIDAFVDALPRGYDSLVGERGGNLSGGQRQRVSIARALVRNPRILLLDEATSALDPQTERQINETLHRASSGRTVVSITHRLTSIVDYDKIFVIVDGRLEEAGTHDDLVAQRGVYAHLWAEQTGGVVPSDAPFDAAGALRRVPLFRTLADPALAQIVDRLHAASLPAGESIPDGGRRLYLVARGRAEALQPGLDGAMAPTADLGPGDTFGLNALLGDTTGGELRAVDAVQLLVLEPDALDAIATAHPEVAEALAGRTSPAGTRVRGRRVERATVVGRTGTMSIPVTAQAAPQATDVRRMTGTFPRYDA